MKYKGSYGYGYIGAVKLPTKVIDWAAEFEKVQADNQRLIKILKAQGKL